MTCIVGVKHEDTMYVGADSAGSDDDGAIRTRADEKVFVSDDEQMIIGFAGSFRVGQLVRYALAIPEQSIRKDDMSYMVTDFVDAIRSTLKDKGALTVIDDTSEQHDSELIVGYHGDLYIIDSDYQISKHVEEYAAVGSGAQVALGALYATKNNKDVLPQDRLLIALSAAAEYTSTVRGPFIIKSLKWEE